MAVVLPESVVEKLRKLHAVREEQDVVARKINKFNVRLSEATREKAERFSDKLWIKLREYYGTAKRLAELEERLCGQCAAELEALVQPQGSGPQANRKKSQDPTKKSKLPSVQGQGRKGGEHRPAPGEQVAARVSPPGAEKDDWIVVKVLNFDNGAEVYEVLDEEPGEELDAGPRKYRLEPTCIIPLPRPTDPATGHEFGPGSTVLAVYPGTTSLYRASVVFGEAPRKNKDDEYVLEFDDDEEEGFVGLPQRRVPFHHVVPLPAGHKQ